MQPIWKHGLFGVLLCSPLIAQQPQRSTWYPAHPIAGSANAASTPATPVGMLPAIAPIFVEDGKTSSSLVIINNSAIKAGATISVRALSGSEIVNVHRTLKPHEQQEIPLQSLLIHIASPPSIGSVTVDQDSDLKGMTIASQLLLTRRDGSSPSYVDEELAMPAIDGSEVLRGVADSSVGTALLAISSNVGWVQHLTLRCLSAGAEYKPTTLTLGPQATVLIASCTGQTANDITSFEEQVGSGSEQRIEGYELVTDGGPGTIAAFGLAPHRRNHYVILSGIPFVDPRKINSPNMVFAGVPFGPQPTLPDGIYRPRISLSNFGSSPAHVTVSIATTQQNEASLPSEPGPAPEKRSLREITIAPRRTVEFALNDENSQSGLLQSVIVESDRKPGEVVGKVVSRSDGTLYEIELLGKDQMDENNGGIHPWSVEGDFESHLLLFNYSAKPRTFGVGVANGVIVWDKKYTLAPYETREISFNQLIQDKVKDDKGQILSPDRNQGAVNWMVPDSGEGTGRLMVTSHSQAIARNFSCGNFIVVCGSQVWTNFSSFPINSIAMAGYTAEPQFCDEFSPSQCGGGSNVSSGSANYTWNIGAASVVRPNTSSDQYVQSPNLYGVGVGTGSSSVAMTAGSCTTYGYPPGPTVTQCPSSVSLSSTTPIQLESDFPTYKTGIGLVASMKVSGSSSNSYNSSKVSESLSVNGVMQNTCSAYVSECNGSATFTVGTGGDDYGVGFAAVNNIYYDDHSLTNGSSILGGSRPSTCTYSCNQTYYAVSDPSGNSCGSTNIGHFLISYTLKTDTIQGTPVTRVTVTKQ